MKASELVAELSRLICQNGDLPVRVRDHVEGSQLPTNKFVLA